MNATSSFHFLIGTHPVDLLRLGLAAAAEQKRLGEAIRPLMAITFGGGTVLAACDGLPPAQGGAARPVVLGSPVLTVAHTGTEVEMILPSTDGGGAEWLDRSREPLARRGHDLIFVAVALPRAGTDLPPLEPGDHLSCFWELGDLHPRGLLEEESAGGFGDVAERLACQSATFDGIHLYSRNEARHQRLRPWAETICRDAGNRLVGGGNVLMLAGHDLHVLPV